MGTIRVNGMSISGSNISITNGKIIVDGKDMTPDQKEIKIEVIGDIDTLSVDACNEVSVKGNIGKLKTMSGDVEVTGDVTGDVSSMSGDIRCGNISGSVKTMSGNIKRN